MKNLKFLLIILVSLIGFSAKSQDTANLNTNSGNGTYITNNYYSDIYGYNPNSVVIYNDWYFQPFCFWSTFWWSCYPNYYGCGLYNTWFYGNFCHSGYYGRGGYYCGYSRYRGHVSFPRVIPDRSHMMVRHNSPFIRKNFNSPRNYNCNNSNHFNYNQPSYNNRYQSREHYSNFGYHGSFGGGHFGRR